MIIRKGFKYRLYPNQEQEVLLAVQFGSKRYIYNWGIDQSQERYPGYSTLADQLPGMKRRAETAWLSPIQRQTCQTKYPLPAA